MSGFSGLFTMPPVPSARDDGLLPVKTPAQQELEDIDRSMHQPATPANYLWIREWGLNLEKEGTTESARTVAETTSQQNPDLITQEGTALRLSDFRFTFSVEMSAMQTPWKLTATVYNVPPKLAAFAANEFTGVTLVAGYRNSNRDPRKDPALTDPGRDVKKELVNISPPGEEPVYGLRDTKAEDIGTRPQNVPGGSLIFTGTVIWYERGRENATDTFLRIHALQYDVAWNFAMINTALAAGHTPGDIMAECVKSMNEADPNNKQPISVGKVPPTLNDTKSPRARTLYGMPRDILRDVAQSADGFCHIDASAKLNLVTLNDPAPPTPPIIINSDKGMVGIPHQNMDGGMSVQTLLNPNIWPGTRVQLNEEDITRKTLAKGVDDRLPIGKAEEIQAIQINQTSMIAKDGIYMVWSVTHHGDTRGNPWYTDMTTRSWSPSAAKTN